MNNKSKIKIAVMLLSLIILCSSCGDKKTVSVDKDTLFQVSTLQALMQGYYNPVSTVGELKQNGDFGIGCFEGVNGELIMLDGTVYQAIHDSTVLTPSDETTIPYATVTFFDADINGTFDEIASIEDLKNRLDAIVQPDARNLFYFVRIDGTFDTLTYRSEYEQHKPYKPLDKAMETDQTFFNTENEAGTIVGLYCPDYMGGLNSIGWHLHFVNADKKNGGHLLAVTAKNASYKLDRTNSFRMKLTANEDFQELPLSLDMSKQMYEVETK